MGEKRNSVVEESQNVHSLIFIGQLVTVLALLVALMDVGRVAVLSQP